MTDNSIHLPLFDSKNDPGAVFDAAGQEFCCSYGTQDDAASKAACIVQAVNLYGDLVALAERLVQGDVEAATKAARSLLEQVRAVPATPQSLEDVQAGDLVARWHYHREIDHIGLAVVTRVTPTQIIVGEDRFSKTTGQMVGGFWTSDKLKPLTPDLQHAFAQRVQIGG